MTDATHWARIAVRSPDVTEWERQFCASVIAQANRRAFKPTPKQSAAIERIRQKLIDAAREDDAPVIEDRQNAR